MTLPFLHKTVVGLHITPAAVYWVELRRFGSRTRVIRFGSEQVSGRDLGDVLQSLAARRFGPNTLSAVSLGLDQVERVVFDVPEMEDEDMLEDWIVHQQAQLTGSAADTVSRTLLLQTDEGHLRCITGVAGSPAIEEARELLARAGFVPAYTGDLLMDAAAPYLLNDENRSGALWVVYANRHAAYAVELEDGTPVAVAEILRPDGREEVTFGVLDEHLRHRISATGRGIRVVVTGDPEICSEAANAKTGAGVPYTANMPDFGTGPAHEPLPAEYAPAAGAARRYLNEDLPGLNFLDPDAVEAARTQIERRDATRSILAAAVIVLCLLLGSEALNAYVNGRIAETEEAILTMRGRIQAIEMEEMAVKRLQYELDEGRRLVSERTFAAGLIEQVGRAMPDGVWLVRLDTYFEQAEARVRLSGHSLDEAGVSELMRKLERTDPFERVRLLHTEAKPPERRYAGLVPEDTILHHFELAASVSLLTAGN